MCLCRCFEEGCGTSIDLYYTTERVPVYNLSIPGSPTYYVGEHGVWVHNCDVIPGSPWSILKYIQKNGKAPKGFAGGREFKNYERKLPVNVKYKEWDIYPTPSKNDYGLGANRGSERLVSGDDGSWHYSPDHYTDFMRLE